MDPAIQTTAPAQVKRFKFRHGVDVALHERDSVVGQVQCLEPHHVLQLDGEAAELVVRHVDNLRDSEYLSNRGQHMFIAVYMYL